MLVKQTIKEKQSSMQPKKTKSLKVLQKGFLRIPPAPVWHCPYSDSVFRFIFRITVRPAERLLYSFLFRQHCKDFFHRFPGLHGCLVQGFLCLSGNLILNLFFPLPQFFHLQLKLSDFFFCPVQLFFQREILLSASSACH